MSLDKVRQPREQLIRDVALGRHGEDLVQLLERELLSLPHKAEDHEPRHEVEACVEAKGTCGSHDGPHTRECQAEDAGKGVVDADGPGHALLSLDGGEDLGRVLEGDGPFA